MILHYGWASDPALWITWPGIYKHKTQSYDPVVMEPLKNEVVWCFHTTWSYGTNRPNVMFHGKRAFHIIAKAVVLKVELLSCSSWLGCGSFQDWVERRRKRPVGLKAWFNKEMNEPSSLINCCMNWCGKCTEDKNRTVLAPKTASSLVPWVGMSHPPNWITIDRSVLDWTNKVELYYTLPLADACTGYWVCWTHLDLG